MRIRSGAPPKWRIKSEKQSKWTEEERERVLEALSSLPKELLDISVNGIYRLKQSKLLEKNPAAGHEDTVVLYDAAFNSNQNLARVIGHEFAHRLYDQLTEADARAYNLAADWVVRRTPGGDVVFVPMRVSFVEDDGLTGPNEDFANNIEYFLFNSNALKDKAPKVYDWIRQKYHDSFKLVKGR